MGKKLIIKGADFSENGIEIVNYKPYIYATIMQDSDFMDRLAEYFTANASTITIDGSQVPATTDNANTYYDSGYYKQLYFPIHRIYALQGQSQDVFGYRVAIEGRVTASGLNSSCLFSTFGNGRRCLISKKYATSTYNGFSAAYKTSSQDDGTFANAGTTARFDFTVELDPDTGIKITNETDGTTFTKTPGTSANGQTTWALFNLAGGTTTGDPSAYVKNMGGFAVKKVEIYSGQLLVERLLPCLDRDGAACLRQELAGQYLYPSLRTVHTEESGGSTIDQREYFHNLNFGFTAGDAPA